MSICLFILTIFLPIVYSSRVPLDIEGIIRGLQSLPPDIHNYMSQTELLDIFLTLELKKVLPYESAFILVSRRQIMKCPHQLPISIITAGNGFIPNKTLIRSSLSQTSDVEYSIRNYHYNTTNQILTSPTYSCHYTTSPSWNSEGVMVALSIDANSDLTLLVLWHSREYIYRSLPSAILDRCPYHNFSKNILVQGALLVSYKMPTPAPSKNVLERTIAGTLNQIVDSSRRIKRQLQPTPQTTTYEGNTTSYPPLNQTSPTNRAAEKPAYNYFLRINLAVFIDAFCFRDHYLRGDQDRAFHYVTTTVNMMNLLYGHESLGQTRIEVFLVKIEGHVSVGPYFFTSGDYAQYLDQFCIYQNLVYRNVSSRDKPWHVALLYSGIDLWSGNQANTNGGANTHVPCTIKACGVIEAGGENGFNMYTVATHETSHILGLLHDQDYNRKECVDKHYIMSRTPSQSLNYWSACSRDAFQVLLKPENHPSHNVTFGRDFHDSSGSANVAINSRYTCMAKDHKDVPFGLDTNPSFLIPLDQQCQAANGQMSYYNRARVGESCRGLVCLKPMEEKDDPQVVVWASIGPALEYSYCGNSSWCQGPQCVPYDGQNVTSTPLVRKFHPAPINGQWSPWRVYKDCEHSCIYGAIPLQKWIRTCSYPYQTFGGKYCGEGEPGNSTQSNNALMANLTAVKCPREAVSRQCSKFSTLFSTYSMVCFDYITNNNKVFLTGESVFNVSRCVGYCLEKEPSPHNYTNSTDPSNTTITTNTNTTQRPLRHQPVMFTLPDGIECASYKRSVKKHRPAYTKHCIQGRCLWIRPNASHLHPRYENRLVLPTLPPAPTTPAATSKDSDSTLPTAAAANRSLTFYKLSFKLWTYQPTKFGVIVKANVGTPLTPTPAYNDGGKDSFYGVDGGGRILMILLSTIGTTALFAAILGYFLYRKRMVDSELFNVLSQCDSQRFSTRHVGSMNGQYEI